MYSIYFFDFKPLRFIERTLMSYFTASDLSSLLEGQLDKIEGIIRNSLYLLHNIET